MIMIMAVPITNNIPTEIQTSTPCRAYVCAYGWPANKGTLPDPGHPPVAGVSHRNDHKVNGNGIGKSEVYKYGTLALALQNMGVNQTKVKLGVDQRQDPKQ